jgi:DNA-binding NarL/FixJ family response regulator
MILKPLCRLHTTPPRRKQTQRPACGREVLRLISKGYTTGQIAETLRRSVNTIDAHRANLKRKFNLRSGSELARARLPAEE